MSQLSFEPQLPEVQDEHGLFAADSLCAAARRLQAGLPETASGLVMLCEDRAAFLAGLLAAIERGVPLLLPPNRSRGALAELLALHPGAVLVHEPGGSDPDWPADWRAVPVRLARDGKVEDAADPCPRTPPDDQTVAVAHTSGSTGRPQAALKSWDCLARSTHAALKRFGFDADSRIVATVPPQHMYGFELSILVPLFSGARVWRGLPFYPADVQAALQAMGEGCWLVTTPLHLRALLRSGLEWPRLCGIVSATAPLDPALAEQAEQCFAAPLHEIYGCTEAGSMASRRTVEGDAWTPYAGMRFHIGPDGSARVEADWLPESVALGDLLRAGEAGRFRLVGRKADLINIAGKRASLADLNLRLNAIEGVLDGVFLPPESDEGRLRAVVVAPGLSERDILDALAAQLDPVFLPRPLYRVDGLPRNATGKLPRAALEALLARLEEGRCA